MTDSIFVMYQGIFWPDIACRGIVRGSQKHKVSSSGNICDLGYYTLGSIISMLGSEITLGLPFESITTLHTAMTHTYCTVTGEVSHPNKHFTSSVVTQDSTISGDESHLLL